MNATFDFFEGEERTRPAKRRAEFRPRPYQLEAVAKVLFTLGYLEKCGLYLATGTGKTEVAVELIKQWKGSVLFIAPRRELVRQTAARLRGHGVDCGIEMAGDRSDENVTVACYASLRSKDRFKKFLKIVTLVIVDEAHINYSEASLEMLKAFRSFGAKVVAMTATPPSKTGDEYILADHYGEPAFVYSYPDAVNDGWLVPCKVHLCVLEHLDLSKFKASFGDFDQKRLDRLMKMRENVAGVGRMIEQYWDGKKSVVFATSIAHAEAIRDDLVSRNIHASIVHSQMDSEEQQFHLDDYMSGRSDIIINVGILTMGWDCPGVQKLFIARCTASTSLYIQMLGRATRVLTGVLDGYEDADDRKKAIARSDKPFMEVYDITDSSRNNSVQSAFDVLYPDVDAEVKRIVQRRTEGKTIPKDDLDKIVEQERQAQAARLAALDRLEMQRRLRIGVGGNVQAFERDINAAPERKGKGVVDYWWMPFGKHRGKPFKRIQGSDPGYLPWMLNKGYLKQPNLRTNVITFLRNNYKTQRPTVQSAIRQAFETHGVKLNN